MSGEELFDHLKSAGPLTARDAVQRYVYSLLPAVPGRTQAYGIECDNTQTLAFVTDTLPALIRAIRTYKRDQEVTLLDLGPGYGGAAGLISEMFCSNFLWAKVKVDALDIRNTRKDFVTFRYPLVNFMVGDIVDQPGNRKWDIIYCSNVIEHTKNPAEFLRALMSHVNGTAIILAPYRDGPDPVHVSVIDESTFSGWKVLETALIHDSLGWRGRTQILAVIQHP